MLIQLVIFLAKSNNVHFEFNFSFEKIVVLKIQHIIL